MLYQLFGELYQRGLPTEQCDGFQWLSTVVNIDILVDQPS